MDLLTLYSRGLTKAQAKVERLRGGTEILCRKCHDEKHKIVRKKKGYGKRHLKCRIVPDEVFILKVAGYDDILLENLLNGFISKSQTKKYLKRNTD